MRKRKVHQADGGLQALRGGRAEGRGDGAEGRGFVRVSFLFLGELSYEVAERLVDFKHYNVAEQKHDENLEDSLHINAMAGSVAQMRKDELTGNDIDIMLVL